MEQRIVYTLAAILTIAIFSFLWKDNPLYKFAEHLVVGISAGYWAMVLYHSSFLTKVLDPLKHVFTGTIRSARDPLVFVPMLIGLMLFTRFIPKIAWISRFSMAYILGVGSGAAIPLVLQTNVVQQIYPTMSVFLPGQTVGTWAWITNLLVLAGVLCGLGYFFFSARHEGVLGGMSKAGIWLLMVGFGASFGYTVMSRVSLLYGRVNFLIFDWAKPLLHSIFG
jgi:hypothetical protein